MRCADHPDIVVIAANSDKSEVSMTTMDYQAKSALRLLHRRRRRKLRRRRTRVAASEPTLVNDRSVFVIESWRLRGLCSFRSRGAGAFLNVEETSDRVRHHRDGWGGAARRCTQARSHERKRRISGYLGAAFGPPFAQLRTSQ